MEWTSSAKQELNRIITHIRNDLDMPDVDAEEVATDIQTRIEEELQSQQLQVVTAENIQTIATRIGVQHIASEKQPDPFNQLFEHQLKKPRRIRKKIGTGCFWLFGIILPLITLGVELVTHMCADIGVVDPIPTLFHPILIALVPLANLLCWLTLKGHRELAPKYLGLLLGAALSIAAFYAFQFAILTPFAVMGLVAIVFGIGIIALLPLSPLLSLIVLLRSRVLLKRHWDLIQLPNLRVGLLAGLIVVVLASTPVYLTKTGLAMAASESPKTQLRGIHLLRNWGHEAIMNRACYYSGDGPTDPISWLINRNSAITPDKARDIYFRVTGVAFNSMAAPTLGIRNRRNPGGEFDWDPELGGDVVAGRLKGLTLSDSRMDGRIEEDAAMAYIEWTMVFRNEWHREREARAQIALPPGAVVSRLTLWVDGEEREAAFGGRSQVKQAYKKVVQRRRDPVLVTTNGPDRILMQCYPVPSTGEMKIRIGITAPLALLSETERVLRLPYMRERNFRIPNTTNHAIWLTGGKNLISHSGTFRMMPDGSISGEIPDAQLNTPAGIIKGQSQTMVCTASNGEDSVVQKIQQRSTKAPDHLVIVIDQSSGMEPYLKNIVAALDALPRTIPVTIIGAGDEWTEICHAQTMNDAALRQLQQTIGHLKIAGGCDNSDALRQSWNIPDIDNIGAIIWIHGAQDWSLNSGEKLRQVLERQHHIELIDFQTENGPHRLVEKLGDLSTFRAAPRFASVETDLKDLFRSLSPDTQRWEADRMASETPDPSALKVSDHLIRLYAWDQIRADLSDGKPGNKKALQLALKHHLVTPVSGAVVLETQQQFDEANLKPVESNMVPSVPEPGSLILLVLAALLVFFGGRIVGRIRLALEL